MKMVYAPIAAALIGLAAFAGSSQAQNWPAKPIKIIAPFAPGGAADTLGRIAAEHLSKSLGQSVYVENRPGAGGLIGAEVVAKAPPDGYTLGVSGIASHVIAPAFSPNAPFDPMRDFTHIAYLGGPPIVLVVHPSLGVNSFKDFLAAAKAKSDGVTYVSPGVGTHGFLFAEYLARKENVKLVHVPYKGANPAVMDLIAGHVPVGAMTWSSAAEQIRAGKVKALGVTAESRLPDYPDVPTFKELGYPDFVAATWFSLSGPAKLPPEIAQRLNAELQKILQLPDVQKRLAQDAIEVKLLKPDEFTKFVEAENARWAPIAKAIGPIENN